MLVTAIELRKKALRAVYLDGVLAADVDADTLGPFRGFGDGG